MKSGLRRLAAQAKPPVPIGTVGRRSSHIFNLGGGKADREAALRTYGKSGTIFSIVSLLASSAAKPQWHLYRKPPQDGRVRYTTADRGSDQRIEVVQHAAIKLWSKPNDFHTRFEFCEGSNQHEELTGETYWVVSKIMGLPVAMWYVRPDRMEPVPSPDDFLVGYIYTGPNGEQIPLKLDEVISERLPDPLDPLRGAGPVASILPNIEQQRYATEYQRNLFIAGADPGGIIQVPNKLTEGEFDELVDRWREAHQGVARAGRVGVLENGAQWIPRGATNKDMEYVNLRSNNRDEIREAWRMHKSMLGTVEDVNRANAQTAEEVFTTWGTIPRLDRRRDTLNFKLLPMFGAAGDGVEFDYEDPSPHNREEDNAELIAKATAAQMLVDAGYDHDDVAEVVGLPPMKVSIHDSPVPSLPPRWTPTPDDPNAPAEPAARQRVRISAKRDTVAKVYEQLAEDYPPDVMSWVHHATWMGPMDMKLSHIDLTGYDRLFGRSQADVDRFKEKIEKGKSQPVILVKTPKGTYLKIVDGHGRIAAYKQLGSETARAYVGVVPAEHGDWDTMHDHQDIAGDESGTESLANLMMRPFLASGQMVLNGGRK